MPLAGCRDSVPAGVWGNAPTVSRATNSKEAANKGAGSEASLPVTSRVRRRAPKLLFPPLCCVAPDGRDRTAGLATIAAFFRTQGFRACGRDQRALRSPSGLLRSAHFHTCLFSLQKESPLRRRPKGFPLALWKPSVRTPMFLDFCRNRTDRIRLRHLPQRGRLWGRAKPPRPSPLMRINSRKIVFQQAGKRVQRSN